VAPWQPSKTTFSAALDRQPTPSFDPVHAQSVTGLLPYKPHDPCWIVAEGWPSWLFVASLLQLCCTRFYSNCLGESWMGAVLKSYDRMKIGTPSEFDEEASHQEAGTILLIQGSTEFLLARRKHIPACSTCLFSLNLGSNGFSPVVWHDVKHTSCGGTSSGTWKVGSNRSLLWSNPHQLTRSLSSLLDSLVKCRNPPSVLRSLQDQDLTQVLPVESPHPRR